MIHELDAMQAMGVSHFRLSPHTQDMTKIAHIFRDTLDKKFTSEEAQKKLDALKIPVPFSNGFFHKKPGYAWINGERD